MKYVSLVLILIVGLGWMGGCHKSQQSTIIDTDPIEQGVTERTIGDLCELLGYQPVKVQGYSLVWGLHGTGASECPPAIRTSLLEMIQTTEARKFMAEPFRSMSGEDLINSPDTVAVLVSGDVLPGVPRGGLFNVNVRIPWASQASSLQGGYLMPTDLREVVLGESGPIVRSISAQAIGPVFTDPFAKTTSNFNNDALLRATVLGGGRSIRDRRIQLALTDPDYRISQYLQRRINSRFISTDGKKIADALDRSRIEISVPQQYRNDYVHFFKLLMALYFRDDIEFQKQKLLELNNKALETEVNLEQIALQWEAIGRRSIGYIEPFYESPQDELAYYAARTALNMDHGAAINAMIQIAQNPQHSKQLEAIKYLGKVADKVRVNRALVKLLDDPETQVRLLSYEGLRKVRDPRIHTYLLPGGIQLETVDSTRDSLIYVWADVDPRIIVFGKNIVARREIFYETATKDLALNARPEDEALTIIRILPGGSRHLKLKSSLALTQLIRTLARPYDMPDTPGAGLTFSQLAAVLRDLCAQEIIPAQYFLHSYQPPKSSNEKRPANKGQAVSDINKDAAQKK